MKLDDKSKKTLLHSKNLEIEVKKKVQIKNNLYIYHS